MGGDIPTQYYINNKQDERDININLDKSVRFFI